MKKAALVALVFAASTLSAQAVQTDRRWLPWLGCWQADVSQSGEQSTSGSATCIVPISGSASVEMLTVARHKVVAHDRLDASGRPHTIDGQGCDGMEVVNWSTTGHRALIRSDYVCSSGIKGNTTTIFSITPTGEWLRVEQVRSGDGSTISVSRLRDVGLLSIVSNDVARQIDDKRRTIVAARAAAAAPITFEEINDASYALNLSVVSAWALASDQHMDLDARQVAALTTPAIVPGYAAMPAFAPGYAPSTGNVYVSSSVNAPEIAPPFDGAGSQCFALSTLNCAFSPLSAFNGFGVPLGFAVVRNNGFRNKDGRGFRSGGHDGHGKPDGRPVGRPVGGRPIPTGGRPIGRTAGIR